MQQKIAGKKKKWITVPVVGVLTAAIVTTALYEGSSVAFARPSLPGIEEIINGNSTNQPFKILEIVDNYGSARIGYTVANEEPGYYDDDEVAAISDMASYAERKQRYLNGGVTDPSSATGKTQAFTDLSTNNFAFTFEAFDYGDDPITAPDTAYNNTTAGVKYTSINGSFEENATSHGRYDASDTSGDYLPVKDGSAYTANNLSIDDVHAKLPGSDQTGYFYMHNASVRNANDASLPADRCDVLQFSEITSDIAWQYPFLLYTEDPAVGDDGNNILDADSNTVAYNYYDQNKYTQDTVFEVKLNDNDTADDYSDDRYEFDGTVPATGTIIYSDYDDQKLEYVGYVGKNAADEDVFYKFTGISTPLEEIPLEAGMIPNPLDPTTYIGADSLAFLIADNPSKAYCSVRRANNSDGAAIKKYYINSTNINMNTTGCYEIVSARFQPVNDPDFLPSDFGIVDETDKVPAGNRWYHIWYYKAQATSPYVYNNAETGAYDFIHDYSGDKVDDAYYKGGYGNKELFKKEVLDVDDKDLANICIDVITKKASQVTPEDIANANLIYFTGSNYDGDMTEEAAAAIVSAVANDNKAVILNLKCYLDKVDADKDTTDQFPKLRALFLMLMKDDYGSLGGYIGADGKFNISATQTQDLLDLGKNYVAAHASGKDLSHVLESVFINDDSICNDAIYTDGMSAYSDAKINGFSLTNNGPQFAGFTEVKKDIDEELFYLSVAGKDVDTFNATISKATSIRYILNYGGRRIVGKTAIRVLDLEPYYARDIEGIVNEYTDVAALKMIDYNPTNNAKQNNWTVRNIAQIRDIFAINWFKDNVSNTTKDVIVTGMGTKEFIGRIEDLNESYDLIYIGMDTAYMNTWLENTNTNNKTGDKTKNIAANDNKAYVYRHVGDSIGTSGLTGGDGTWNLSGNDITPDKLRELQNFVKAGYAVILSDEFFTYDNSGRLTGIDTNRVDETSYLYDFVHWCIDEKENGNYKYLYKNVEITRNFESATRTTDGVTAITHKENFVRYLNISKLQVEVIEQPPLYNPYDTNDSNVHHYIGMNASGLYTLDYKVKLTNDAAVDTTNTSYDCELYIDHDADGRFENVEKLDSLEIYNEDKGEYEDVDNDGHYHLTTGARYSISRRVPEGYVGLIPWKLVFIENRGSAAEDSLVKVAIQDYSAISDLTNKPTIKVLQITSGDSNNSNLKLWDDTKLTELYSQVIDFNLSIDHCTAKQFVERSGDIFGTGTARMDKLYEYDMLVLGFLDMYNLSNGNVAESREAILCIREYMLTGRSVLFTHDLTSTSVNGMVDGAAWGSLADKYLRDIQGMDRYGYVTSYVENLTFADGTPLSEYESSYDTRFSGNRESIGFADAAILRHNSWQWGEIAANNTRNISNSNNGQNERELETVTRVNRGQITEYPFRIGSLVQSNAANGDNNYYASEHIKVAKTHHQYFQLNLETDYRDDNHDDDIVVWYTISLPGTEKANYHKLNYNDVRNNYYIYNKGNITYTGAGHSKIDGEVEKKLFVNTLVASYNAGTHAPYASYKNNEMRNNKDITSTYIPYDISFSSSEEDDGTETPYSENGWLQDTVTVYFKTVNNNLQDNLDPLVAQYYVEVPSGGDLVVGTKHYKVITPVANSVKECVAKLDGTVTYTDVSDPRVLTNGKTYKMEFNVSQLLNSSDQSLINTRYHAVIYTRMRSKTKGKTTDDDKADMDGTGTITALPANDSLKPLNVNFTQLYDLR